MIDWRIRRAISSIRHSESNPRYPKHVHPAQHKEIVGLASKGLVVVYPSSSIKKTCQVIVDNGIRRLPVVDAGTKRLVGIISAVDLVDYFGGGTKHKIIEKDLQGNFLAAINNSISKIMTEGVITAKETESIRDVASLLLSKGIGGCPIINKENKVVAVVSERDFINHLAGEKTGIRVKDCMNRRVETITEGTKIIDASKIMINNGRRRLPVIHENSVVGMLRTYEILSYISDNGFADLFSKGYKDYMDIETKDIMNKTVITVNPEQDIGEVADIMQRKRFGGFPVLDSDKLIGIITEHDIFRAVY